MTHPLQIRRRRTLVVSAITVFALGVALAASVGLFGGGAPTSAAGTGNGSPTTLTRVTRQDLFSQTEVGATLGYADPATIVQPAGTAPSALQQAQQAVTTAAGQLAAARTGLAADSAALAHASAVLAADRQKLSVDCAGDAAGQSPSPGSSGDTGGGGASGACAAGAQSISVDAQAVGQAGAKVTTDRQAATSASAGLAGARAALDAAAASATVYGTSSTYTQLPAVGEIVSRNGVLYEISGEPVVLLVRAGRRLAGVRPGDDAGTRRRRAQPQPRALGFGAAPAATRSRPRPPRRSSASRPRTGCPRRASCCSARSCSRRSAVRVTGVTPTVGATVQPGPVLTTTSTARQVTIAARRRHSSRRSRSATRSRSRCPTTATTPGRVTYVGTVATTPSSSDQGGAGRRLELADDRGRRHADCTRLPPAGSTRRRSASRSRPEACGDALVVPVNALLALASGGYAVEVVGADGVHHLVGVATGLFDDADGLVQVTGSRLAAGQRVVVPAQ